MNNNNNHHHVISIVNTDEIIKISACISDTIFKPLYDFTNSNSMNGYAGALDIICRWAKEFYQLYYIKMKDWDTFEESEDNIYNSVCWEDFVSDWINEKFKKFKSSALQLEYTETSELQFYGNSKTPKLIIKIKHHTISAVYSNTQVEFAHLDFDDPEIQNCPLVGIFEPDSIAHDLVTLFDQNNPQERAIQEELISQGF